MTGLVVGVDGGGTKTRAVVLGADGGELGRVEGEPAVANAGDPSTSAEAVAGVVRAAAGATGVTLPVEALWAGLSGAGREPARSSVERELKRTGVARAVHVGTDVEAAFQDALHGTPGILLIAGTGSIAWGRAEDGRQARAGGWGRKIGDEGSAYAIGLEALRSVVRGADGRDPPTRLKEAILERRGLAVVDELVPWSEDASARSIAALARVVMATAAAGDAAAADILSRGAAELDTHVAALLERLGPWHEAPRVALGGGLLQPGSAMRHAVEERLSARGLTALERTPDAALGAASLAAELLRER